MTEEQTPLKVDFNQDDLASANAVVSLSSSTGVSEVEESTPHVPEVVFVSGSSNGCTIECRANGEREPLLPRMESVSQPYNHFPGKSFVGRDKLIYIMWHTEWIL